MLILFAFAILVLAVKLLIVISKIWLRLATFALIVLTALVFVLFLI